ncbi:hypothetical protein GCM10009836_42590 [Pseudonocardia ailaonensis]|uniref:Uncharacterized protein n=1 Tax=Pseudonocardia ailaonensis TaxID=367279 RepID=A0ABN2N8U6_9PSEU
MSPTVGASPAVDGDPAVDGCLADAIVGRRSVRGLLPDLVPDDVVRRLLGVGMFVQNLLVAAQAHRLGTCPQVAAVSYPDEPANTLRTSRVPVDAFATFHR